MSENKDKKTNKSEESKQLYEYQTLDKIQNDLD